MTKSPRLLVTRPKSRTEIKPSEGSAFQAPSKPAEMVPVKAWGKRRLSEIDPEINDLIESEKRRQWKTLELIASENFTSEAVMEALGSVLTNKYSEGLPGSRFYGGNQVIDQIETLCCQRALAAFRLDPEQWGVNVQPYSCSSANFAVFTALLKPKDRIMGLDVTSGGHVSHGHHTGGGKKVSGASLFFETLSYKVNPSTGYIDYEKLEEKAMDFRPRIIICGGSAYPREWDYARFRKIANSCGAILMCDMAHISGLIAAQECRSPFSFCDIVTSTTHKTLRGPRSGMIFFRRGARPACHVDSPASSSSGQAWYDYEERINFAVCPSLQGGPHNSHVAALAVALRQVAEPQFHSYILQMKRNAAALAAAMIRRGCRLVTGGTDNHLLIWDLRPLGLTGSSYEKVCEACSISLNKNAVSGDASLTGVPGGVRLGTAAMTTRGCKENAMEVVADVLVRAAKIAQKVMAGPAQWMRRDFATRLAETPQVDELRCKVEAFASAFDIPGSSFSE